MRLLLLPGMDGTGLLFAPLLSVLPKQYDPVVVSFPPDQVLGWNELQDCVARAIPGSDPYLILAESFSGPLALRVGAETLNKPEGVILCAAFVSNPMSTCESVFRFLIRLGCFKLSPPQLVVRRFLLGDDARSELLDRFFEAVRGVKPDVLAARATMILDLHAENHLKDCDVPLLYLRATKDRLVSRHCLELMLKVKPTMSVAEINAAHFVVQREPVSVIAEIEKFLEYLQK